MSRAKTHLIIWTFFCACLGCGLFGRWESTRAVHDLQPGSTIELSHDEIILLTLGKNLRRGWDHYHVQEWAKAEKQAGHDVPEYLKRPIFKHPPMLPAALSVVEVPCVEGTKNAFMLMMGTGVLMCAAVYALARCILSPMWSLVPAALAWIDPVLWTGSVKVWLDLPLAVFCTAALAFAWRGRTQPLAFLGMGICFGFAFLTKYPAMAVWALATLLLCVDRGFRKSPLFIAGCLAPWMMLGPWIAWNIGVMGLDFMQVDEFQHVLRVIEARIAWITAGASVAVFLLWMHRSGRNAPERGYGHQVYFGMFLLGLAGLFVMHSWYSGRLEPRAGMTRNFFEGEPAWFYLGRIVTLNPLLWPGLAVLALPRLPAPANFLRWITIAFVLAFSFWGNFQSRYIMPVMPVLCVLSAWGLAQMTEYFSKPRSLWLEKAWLVTWIVFASARLCWIHQHLTLPNQFTYF